MLRLFVTDLTLGGVPLSAVNFAFPVKLPTELPAVRLNEAVAVSEVRVPFGERTLLDQLRGRLIVDLVTDPDTAGTRPAAIESSLTVAVVPSPNVFPEGPLLLAIASVTGLFSTVPGQTVPKLRPLFVIEVIASPSPSITMSSALALTPMLKMRAADKPSAAAANLKKSKADEATAEKSVASWQAIGDDRFLDGGEGGDGE